MPFIKDRTSDQQAIITSNYQPNGSHMTAKRKQGKNLYKWLKGLSVECGRVEQALNDFVDGRNIINETTFLTEWEATAGIPDGDFEANGTAIERQRQVIGKLASEGVSTVLEFEWLCSLFGFSVDVKPGHYYWLNPDPSVVFATERESRFTVVFTIDIDNSIAETDPNYFPVSFPWQFRASNYNQMKKFLLTIIPSNCNGLFILSNISPIIKSTFGATDIIKDTYGATDIIKDKVNL